MLYNPCIKTVDVWSKLVISGLSSSTRVVEWGRDAVWAQPCLTSTSTSWQKLWSTPAASWASLCMTLKSNACCMRMNWFCCPPQPRVSAQPGPAGTVLWGMGSDGQPGQNQRHGVPEEGQVSGKQIPVQLWGEVLEPSTSYSYLGIQISASGGFSLAVKALHEKTRRVILCHQFTVWPIKIWVKLDHAIIKQILLYGSEILGPVIHLKNCDKTSIEKLQLEMIKNNLGVSNISMWGKHFSPDLKPWFHHSRNAMILRKCPSYLITQLQNIY